MRFSRLTILLPFLTLNEASCTMNKRLQLSRMSMMTTGIQFDAKIMMGFIDRIKENNVVVHDDEWGAFVSVFVLSYHSLSQSQSASSLKSITIGTTCS